MKFTHRLAYYLFGTLIGVMFLMFFFKNKRTEFCYLPNCRVLKDLKAKGLRFSEEAQAAIDEKWVTVDDIKNSLENGDVDFSRSNKPNPGGGKIYIIESFNSKNEPITLEVINRSDKAILKSVTR